MRFIFRETWRAIRNAPMTWVMSIITLAVALAVTALFTGAALKARKGLREARESLPIEAFFAPNISNTDAQAIADQEFRRIPGIRSVSMTSHEQALEDYNRISGEDIERILGSNPLPASATIRLHDPTFEEAERTVNRLKSVSGVADVRSDLQLLRMLEERSRTLETVALIFGGLLIITSIFFVALVARLTMVARKQTVYVMQQLGASGSQIVLPVAFEGGLAGLIAGVLAATVIVVFSKTVGDTWTGYIAIPNKIEMMLGCLSVTGLILGFFPAAVVATAASRSRK